MAEPARTDGRTYAVVVNWNGGAANVACLRSLCDQGLAEERVVLVDNGSTDGSVETVRDAFPGTVVLRNAANEGFGHGVNRGVRHALEAGAERVLLLNNDATLDPGALARLERELDADPALGAVGPRILLASEPGRLWCAGARITWRQNLSSLIGFRRPDGPEWRRAREVDYVVGCAMLVARRAFERAGLLDGDYFAYHEDLEYGVRLRSFGMRSRVVGEVAARHDAHGSTGGGYNAARKYMMGVNTIRFLRRHGTPLRWLSFLAFDVLTLPAAWAVRAWRGEGGAVVAKARGLVDGLRGRPVTEEAVRRALARPPAAHSGASANRSSQARARSACGEPGSSSR